MKRLHLDICGECIEGTEANLRPLRDALNRELPDRVEIRLASCLERCETPQNMSIQCRDGAGYVFSGLDFATDAEDVVATCHAYLNSKDGWIEDARPCGRLRFCLAARLPA